MQILNAKAVQRKEVNDLIEALLPWINPELWVDLKKQEGGVRENVDFENQFRSMLDGTWDTNPDVQQIPFLDDLHVGGEGNISKVSELFSQQGEQPPTQSQQSGTIRSQLFPGVPPSFKGVVDGVNSPEELFKQLDNQQPGEGEESAPTLRPMRNPKSTNQENK